MVSGLAAVVGILGLTLSLESPRVLVLGLDGGDWDVIDPLVEAGRLPNLASILERSARADLDCAPAFPAFACFCPPVWTSIVTGQPYAVHRIATTLHRSSRRLAPAIWELNDAHGGVSTLVSIRGSWPPEDDAGFVFTEPGLDVAAGKIHDRWWIAPPHPGLTRPATHTRPPGLFELLGLLPHSGERLPAWQMFARDRVAMAALSRLERMQRVWMRSALKAAGRDQAHTLTPARVGRSNLVLITFHSIDRAEHMGWHRVQPEVHGPVDPDLVVALADRWDGPVFDPPPWGWGSAVSQYLEADVWLGEHLADFAYDAIVVVSDHGMGRNTVAGARGHHGTNVPDAHLGVLAIHAPGVREGADLGEVSVLDVAPTLAYLLGLPVATRLPGRPLDNAFAADWVASHPIQWTPTW